MDAKTVSHEWASHAAERWASRANRLAMGGMYPALYLYVDSLGDPIWLTEDESAGETWTLAHPEGIRPNLTQQQVRNRVGGFACSLPILRGRWASMLNA